MNSLPNDAALPTLAALFDWSAVTTGFRACADLNQEKAEQEQPWQVTQCQHLRYQPGVRCTATYTLRKERSGQPPLQTIGVVDCTPAGLRYRPFAQDEALPWLTAAADPAVITDRLATLATEATTQATNAPPEPTPWRVTPIRYRPGERCAFQYSRQSATGVRSYFGKLLRQPHPQRVAALPRLYTLAQQDTLLPRLPCPLAYWPDLQLLIQPAINGAELHAVLFDETLPVAQRVQWFHQMGAKVAALHNLAPLALPLRTVADEWPELLTAQPLIQQLSPALAPDYATTLATLMATAASLPPAPPVVCHGALRTDQFLLNQAELHTTTAAELLLIDLDTLCLADPACDLGNCLAYLTWKALRQPRHTGLIQHGSAAFLTGYSTTRRLPDEAALAFYQALALLKIAGRRFSNLSYREWPLTPALVQSAAALLRAPSTHSRMATPL